MVNLQAYLTKTSFNNKIKLLIKPAERHNFAKLITKSRLKKNTKHKIEFNLWNASERKTYINKK